MSGSLLGVVRDGDFMAHDYDIDLGLMPGADLDLVLRNLALCSDYEISRQGDRGIAAHASGARTDIFPHTLRDGLFWHGTLVHEWWNTPFELTSTVLRGDKFWVPDPPEKYLDENYGNWHRPVAFYDISFDTPNRRYRRTGATLLHLHSVCLKAIAANDRWTVESAARELNTQFGVDITELLNSSPLIDSPTSDITENSD